MNCHYHPDRKADAHCSDCRKPLCELCAASQKDGSNKCSRCIAIDAANEASEGISQHLEEKALKGEHIETQRERKKRRETILQVCFVLVCLAIIAFQISSMMSYDTNRPLRHGTYNTGAQTDDCVTILWEISKKLQKDDIPGNNILCPGSKKPFEIEKTNGDIIVRSPAPELYGFKDIRVSRKHPVPRLIK
ncbi:hypothetical protein ACFL1N_03995 [Thermodesulfobacteriota bacterium]